MAPFLASFQSELCPLPRVYYFFIMNIPRMEPLYEAAKWRADFQLSSATFSSFSQSYFTTEFLVESLGIERQPEVDEKMPAKKVRLSEENKKGFSECFHSRVCLTLASEHVRFRSRVKRLCRTKGFFLHVTFWGNRGPGRQGGCKKAAFFGLSIML